MFYFLITVLNSLPAAEADRRTEGQHAMTTLTSLAAHRLDRVLVQWAGILALTGCGIAENAQPTLSTAQMMESLVFIEETLRSAHYGSIDGLNSEAARRLQEVRERAGSPMTEEAFYFEINYFLAALKDAHTVARWHDDTLAEAGSIDLPVHWNENGLLVMGQTDRLRPGDRIVQIGGLDEADILDRLELVIPAENQPYLKALAGKHLSRGPFLRHFGVVEADGGIVLTVESPKGTTRSERLRINGRKVDSTKAPWFGFEIYTDYSLGVFRIDRMQYDEKIAAAIEQFFAAIDEHSLRNVAVDLRENPGGDSLLAFAFLAHFEDYPYESFGVDIRVSEELDRESPQFSIAAMNEVFYAIGMPELPPDTDRYRLPGALVKQIMLGRLPVPSPGSMTTVTNRDLYVVTGPLTFSSASLFTTLVRDNRLGKIVGEPTGNRVNFYGSELRVDIPNTNMYLNLSTAKMLRPNADLGEETTIDPDVYLPVTVDSAAAGLDPSMQYLKTLSSTP